MTVATYVAINRGQTGTKQTDFVGGASSAGGTSDIEIRLSQTDQLSNPITKKDLVLAINAFKRYVEIGANQGGR